MRILWILFNLYFFLGVLICFLLYFSSFLFGSIYASICGFGYDEERTMHSGIAISATIGILCAVGLLFAYAYSRLNGMITYPTYLLMAWVAYLFIIVLLDTTLDHDEDHEKWDVVPLIVSSPLIIVPVYLLMTDYSARYARSNVIVTEKQNVHPTIRLIILLACLITVSNILMACIFRCILDGIIMRVIVSCSVIFLLDLLDISSGNKRGWIWIYASTSYVFFTIVPVLFTVFLLQAYLICLDIFSMRGTSVDSFDLYHDKIAKMNRDDKHIIETHNDGLYSVMDINSETPIFTNDTHGVDPRKRHIYPDQDRPLQLEWMTQDHQQRRSPEKKDQRTSRNMGRERTTISLAVQNLLTEEDNLTVQEKKIEE